MIQVGSLKLSSLDYILVVNREFLIIYGSRYDDRVDAPKGKYDPAEYMNRNFFEVYPSVKKETSSIVKCLATGEIIVKKFQKFEDYTGKFFCTHNITVPLIRKGRIVGAIELIKDVTTIENVDHRAMDTADREFDEVTELVRGKAGEITFEQILTRNPAMEQSIQSAKLFAKMHSPTLIYGETGTGKELFAQAMITHSGIPRSRVVVQNCAAVPDNLIESILFGTSRGAYTGAENRRGLFEEADGGIFFLDELNSLSYAVQGKLLRVLQDGTFRPVGSNAEKKVSVKIIAAMNVDPMVAIEKKQLRSDLFYRLSSGMLYLPPLRERPDDIDYYTKYYIDECNMLYSKQVRGITDALREVFLSYRWEGNVREFKHALESMISVADGPLLDVQDLPAYMYGRIHGGDAPSTDHWQPTAPRSFTGEEADPSPDLELPRAVERTERSLIVKVLRMTRGNKTRAGELLAIPRQTLWYKMNKYGITDEDWS
ncbi:arginine utilization regulatory protein [Oscillospiraceae bacterium]|nr:arginine utilization regulatory protein [Oscillospiraceae bacterium]BDF76159.1 arginine utilization regulatory protein [Oscillospiraceae bacterium]